MKTEIREHNGKKYRFAVLDPNCRFNDCTYCLFLNKCTSDINCEGGFFIEEEEKKNGLLINGVFYTVAIGKCDDCDIRESCHSPICLSEIIFGDHKKWHCFKRVDENKDKNEEKH